MIGQVIHHERLAWDTARMITRTLESNHLVGWLRDQFAALFGPAFGVALLESHARLWASTRPDAPQVEIGIWRAKLEDVLQADMALCEPLMAVLADASARLGQAVDVRVPAPAWRPRPPEPRIIDLDRYGW